MTTLAMDDFGFTLLNGKRPPWSHELPTKKGKRRGGSRPPHPEDLQRHATAGVPTAGTVHLVITQPPTDKESPAGSIAGTTFYPNLLAVTDWGQGEAADCYFDIVIQMLQLQRPGDLQKILRPGSTPNTATMTLNKPGYLLDVTTTAAFPAGGFAGFNYNNPRGSKAWYGQAAEKIYVYGRNWKAPTTSAPNGSSPNVWSDLDDGWMGDVWADLGVSSMLTSFSPATAATMITSIKTAIAANQIYTAITNATTTDNLVEDHAHGIIAIQPDNSFVLRQPWDDDFSGTSTDGDNDGIFVVSSDVFFANFQYGCVTEFTAPAAPWVNPNPPVVAPATPSTSTTLTAKQATATNCTADSNGTQPNGSTFNWGWVKAGSTVTFGAAPAGTASIYFARPGAGTCPVQVFVGGVLITTLSISSTGSWGTYEAFQAAIPAGVVEVVVGGDGAINIGDLVVSPPPASLPFTLTAKQATATNCTADSNGTQPNGSTFNWGWVKAGSTVTFGAAPAGTASIYFARPGAGTCPVQVFVGGVLITTLSISSTGSWGTYEAFQAAIPAGVVEVVVGGDGAINIGDLIIS